nr:sortase [Actinomycetota bacterium]
AGDGNGSTNTNDGSATVAPGSGERFGMGPEASRTQGHRAPPRAEPSADEPNRPTNAQGPTSPRAPEPSVSSTPPDPAEDQPSIAAEPTRPQPQDVAVAAGKTPPPSAPAPAPKEPSVAETETPESSASPADPAPEPPAEAPAPEGAVPAPTDTTMYLTVPALGLERAPVVDDSSKEAMDQGVIHVPGTGFPWLPSGEQGSNTYLAAHRIGYPGTGSDRVFYELPALALGDEVTLTDSNGIGYEYRVAEAGEVSPYDTWVANPVPGRDVVTLQTCIRDFGDHWGEGPEWAARYVVRAERAS